MLQANNILTVNIVSNYGPAGQTGWPYDQSGLKPEVVSFLFFAAGRLSRDTCHYARKPCKISLNVFKGNF